MNTETVPQAPVGPPGYCGSVADELRRIAAAIDTVGHLELPEPTGVALWLQPIGTDAEVIAGVDALGRAVLGATGEPREMGGGTYHYKAYGQRGPVDVRFFRSIAATTAESVKAASETAARESELARLRARVAELEAQQVGLTYSREDDDPQVVRPHSPRLPLHVAGMVAGGELVDEAGTLSAAIYFSNVQREAGRFAGRISSERLRTATLDLLHEQARAEDAERAQRADVREGEQGRITNPELARFFAKKEEKRRVARYFLGLEESAKHHPVDETAADRHKDVRTTQQYIANAAPVSEPR